MAKVAFGRHKNLDDIKESGNEYISDILSEIKLLLTNDREQPNKERPHEVYVYNLYLILNKLKIKAEFYIKKPSETVYQQKFVYL
jgi:hypothetical protein